MTRGQVLALLGAATIAVASIVYFAWLETDDSGLFRIDAPEEQGQPGGGDRVADRRGRHAEGPRDGGVRRERPTVAAAPGELPGAASGASGAPPGPGDVGISTGAPPPGGDGTPGDAPTNWTPGGAPTGGTPSDDQYNDSLSRLLSRLEGG
jgi:hypothetical protein